MIKMKYNKIIKKNKIKMVCKMVMGKWMVTGRMVIQLIKKCNLSLITIICSQYKMSNHKSTKIKKMI